MTRTEEILAKARNYHTDNEELAEKLEQKLEQADELAADILDLLEDTDFMNQPQPEQEQAEATRRFSDNSTIEPNPESSSLLEVLSKLDNIDEPFPDID